MKTIFCLLTAILFSGCLSSYPMNLSEKEYESLTLKEKVELRKEQEKFDTKLNIQRLKNQRAREKQQYELALKEQENLKQLYKNSKSKVIIFIEKGEIFGTKEYFIAPFEIQKFEVKKIKVYDKNARYVKGAFWISFQESGLYIAVEPKSAYKSMNSYTSYTNRGFFQNLNKSKPAIIPFSYDWYKAKRYKASFKSNYKQANNIEVRVLLKNRY